MFGYVLPEKPELKLREYELFRAYYCGVCKSIARRYGHLPRFALSYDTAFLAVLLASLDEKAEQPEKQRCIAHPAKKRIFIPDNAAVDYAADINIILSYYNMEDNWRDDKSLLSAAGRAALHPAFKKARRRQQDKSKLVREMLLELNKLEKEACSSIDQAAEPFAKLMEGITAYRPLCRDEVQEKVLKWLGYNLGKWIYTLDAFDDIEKDITKKAYNPLVCQHREKEEEAAALKTRISGRVKFGITYSLSEISKAFELLDIKKNKGLLENIIYMGMLRKSEQILSTRSCENSEKSV